MPRTLKITVEVPEDDFSVTIIKNLIQADVENHPRVIAMGIATAIQQASDGIARNYAEYRMSHGQKTS